jgi:hypothetical protein
VPRKGYPQRAPRVGLSIHDTFVHLKGAFVKFWRSTGVGGLEAEIANIRQNGGRRDSVCIRQNIGWQDSACGGQKSEASCR